MVFGSHRRGEEPPPLYPVPDVEEVHDDEQEATREVAVPAESAPTVPLEGTVVPRWQQQANPRPVFAAWLIDPEERRTATRWVVIYVGHTSAFHAARFPVYLARTAMYAPRGAGRALASWVRWVADAEGAPLRTHSVQHGQTAEYMALSRQRNERVKLRSMGSAITAAGSAITVAVVSWEWSWTPYAVAAVAVAALGWVGRRTDRPFFAPAVLTEGEAPRLTGEVVARSLGALGISQINQALAKGEGITFASECHRDGPGWRADVDLPYGVTPGDVMERRDKLASGLRRPIGCVWPEPDPTSHGGRLVLWVGDQDMATARQKPWPLLKTGRTSVFEAVPFGYNQRNRLVSVLLMFNNVLIGAVPRQGKTFTLRVLALAVALDPTVEARVFELKGTGDLSCMEKVAHHYGTGVDETTMQICMDSLQEVYDDLERRAKVIRELPRDLVPENKVTPELAAKKSLGLHPLAFIIDECQELFTHPDHGKNAERLVTGIIKRGPALGVFMLLATQRPDKDSLPTGISANITIRLCLRVMGQTENDMILGTSSYKNGTRATMFTQRDKGVMYAVGIEDDPLILRSSYIDGPGAEIIADRARVLRKQAGTLSGYAIGDQAADVARVSVLADVAAVLQPVEDKIWCQTVVARLAELRPELYGEWSAAQLTEALKPYGVKTRDTWLKTTQGESANRKGFTAKDVQEALSKINRDPR